MRCPGQYCLGRCCRSTATTSPAAWWADKAIRLRVSWLLRGNDAAGILVQHRVDIDIGLSEVLGRVIEILHHGTGPDGQRDRYADQQGDGPRLTQSQARRDGLFDAP